MTPTKPLYLHDQSLFSVPSQILSLEGQAPDGQTALSLDETIFHPQGGGQPADHGTIKGPNGELAVTMVKKDPEGIIWHYGILTGELKNGESVECAVDIPRRALMSRLHSAGHLIDFALKRMDLNLIPQKGYHFPEGPYVEYTGELPEDPTLPRALESILADLIAGNAKTRIEWNGDRRLVYFGQDAIPCGGTHVAQLSDIGTISIRKMKNHKGLVRIAYDIN